MLGIELLGEGDLDLRTVLLVTIPTLIGSAVTWLVTQKRQWRKELREEGRSDTDVAIKRIEALLKRVDKDREEAVLNERKSQEIIATLREQIRKIEVKAERAIAWIRHLEVHLDRQQIPYPEFHEMGDTGRHTPLTPIPAGEEGPKRERDRGKPE